jgi:hypothetical protein
MIATGTHRISTDAELEQMLGRDIVGSCRVLNHDSRDKASLEHVGRTATGVDAWLNREWLAADVRLTTGFVEPHFFAGFSGGPKMVAPGLADSTPCSPCTIRRASRTRGRRGVSRKATRFTTTCAPSRRWCRRTSRSTWR